jgi:hypothetical protein
MLWRLSLVFEREGWFKRLGVVGSNYGEIFGFFAFFLVVLVFSESLLEAGDAVAVLEELTESLEIGFDIWFDLVS